MIIIAFTLAAITAYGGLKVITSKNPINSIFYLVFTFVLSAILLLLSGIEFISIIIIIVYVGAIAILFLFVVMMLNIKLVEIWENSTRYVPIGLITGLLLMYLLFDNIHVSFISSHSVYPFSDYSLINLKNNIALLGNVLYTKYYEVLIIASIILLVSMIGAIVLTLYHASNVRRQDLFTQIER